MHVALDKVPLREASMSALEVLTSESQERMLAIVQPDRIDEVLAHCDKWGVLATVIGEVTDGDRLVVTWHDEVVVDAPPASLADDGPVYTRPVQRPDDEQDSLHANGSKSLSRPERVDDLRDTLLRLAASPELCSRRWVTEQYDRYVLGGTVLAMPHDGGVVRLGDDTLRGIALALDGNGRFAKLDPHAGAQLNLAEAYRNVACTGATPIAVTNCLNFGSPEDPAVMWQFAEATRGLAEGCRVLGTPVTGGNVSFYNQTGATAINPTPVIGVLGVLDDVTRRLPSGFSEPGRQIVLLGETDDELDGSAWAWVEHGHLGGRPPIPRLGAEKALARLLNRGAAHSLINAAHDLSEGGLGQALVEATLLNGVGARVSIDGDPFITLFSESTARVIVTSDDPEAVLALAADLDVPATQIGITGGDSLSVTEGFDIPLAELRAGFEGTLPALFG
jgi:phosphoribosylformylglycinamidine synthase